MRSILLNIACTFLIVAIASGVCGAADNGSTPPRVNVPAATPGVYVVDRGTASVVIQRDGKSYVVDLDSRSVREMDAAPTQDAEHASSSTTAQQNSKVQSPPAAADTQVPYYIPGDERLFTLPTGQRLQKGGMTVTFTHRFPYSAAFQGRARGAILDGLDDIAIPSFGFKYGITSRLAVSAFRSPSIIGRPMELMASYLISEERTGAPFGAMFRFSVDGQDDFRRNFTTNFEGIFSRSITSRAALYLVPTVSIHNRPVLGANAGVTVPPALQPCAQALANGVPASMRVRPCANTFSLGVGLAVDIRPTVAIIVEANPTLANGTDIGIHRSPFSIGIQKKIFRHAFTFGFTTAPGSTVAQRAGTRATYLRSPNADTPSGLFVGFNLSRQLR